MHLSYPRHAPVVLIARHFPPSREVGAIRARRIAEALARAGHPVTVIRADGDGAGDVGLSVDEAGFRVQTVRPLPSPRAIYARIRRGLSALGDRGGDPAPPAHWVPPTEAHPLKRLLISLLWLPDDEQGFIFPAAVAAAEQLRAAGPGAVLYTTSPPHSAQLAGLLASTLSRARWIMEFRDPWTGNPGKSWLHRSSVSDACERWLERVCLRRARAIVGVSDGICRQVATKLSRYRLDGPMAPRIVLARNGIDRLDPAPWEPRRGPFRIVHAGTLYLGRDPRPFLAALGAVVRRRRLGPDALQVELIGASEVFEGRSVREMVETAGLGGLVQLEGWLAHDVAQARIRSADLLLLLAERQPLQIPNKLYEYLGTGRPILAFADAEGETAEMLRAVGGHWVVQGGASAEAEAALEAALDGGFPDRDAAGHRLLEEWAADRQIARVVESVGAVGRVRSGDA